MKYLSLFSGIEAASVAWKPMGWEAMAFAEIERFPSEVLAARFPAVPNLGDVTKFKEWDSYEPSVVVGGSPCQTFSVAGLRKGLDDPRGNLTLTYLAVVARYRPQWVVWENVPGVLSIDGGKVFGAFLGGLGQLGYGFAYRILDAQYFGVPQRRRRVFVVGHLGDWRRAAAVLFERHSLQGHPAPSRQAGKSVAPTIAARTKGGGELGTDFDCDGGLVGSLCADTHPGGYTGQDAYTGRLIAHPLRAEGFDGSEDGMGRGTPIVPIQSVQAVREKKQNGIGIGDPGDPMFTMTSRDQHAVAFAQNQRNELREIDVAGALAGEPGMKQQTYIAFSAKDSGADAGEVSPTLRANSHANSHANAGVMPTVAFEARVARNGRGAPADIVPPLKAQSGESGKGDAAPLVATAMQVRRLTPRECERLQGFPDDYTLITSRGKPAADGPRYKALGNSMAVPCMAWLGRRIEAVESIKCS